MTLAASLSIQLSQLLVALDAAEGLDDHDWIPKVLDVLQLNVTVLFRPLVAIWLQLNVASADQFVVQLREAMTFKPN